MVSPPCTSYGVGASPNSCLPFGNPGTQIPIVVIPVDNFTLEAVLGMSSQESNRFVCNMWSPDDISVVSDFFVVHLLDDHAGHVALRRILIFLHDPKYLILWDLWCICSIVQDF